MRSLGLLVVVVSMWLSSVALAQSRPSFLDQPAQVRMVGSSRAPKVPLLVVLPATGTTAEEMYGWTRAGLTIDHYAVLLPAGRPSTSDYLPAFGKFVDWYQERLLADIDRALSSMPIDPNRVFLVGFSLGGDLSCALMARHPERFRGAYAIGSRCSATFRTTALAKMKERDVRMAFAIGNVDQAARITGITRAHANVSRADIKARFVTYDGAHVPPPPSLAREAFAFLFSRTRKDRCPEPTNAP